MQHALFDIAEDLTPTPTLPKPKRNGSAGAPGPRRENSMVYRYKRGDVVGKLTLLEPHGKGKWLCRCECGREGIRSPHKSRSCLWCRPKQGRSPDGVELVREELSKPTMNDAERKLAYGYNQAYHRARRANIAFTLTREQYAEIVSCKCEYCGGPLPESGSGLDRINCKDGYTLANCVPCCKTCNRVKGEAFSYREMKVLGSVIRNLVSARKSRTFPDAGPAS